MRTILSEYGGMILGVLGAAAVIRVTVSMLFTGGSIYEVIAAFSYSIC